MPPSQRRRSSLFAVPPSVGRPCVPLARSPRVRSRPASGSWRVSGAAPRGFTCVLFFISVWAARRHVVPRGKSKCGECASCAQPRLRLGCLNPTQSTPKKSELDSLECSLTSAQYRLPAERVVPLSVQKSKATGSQYTPKQHMPEEQKVLDPKHQSQVAHLQAELQQLKNQVAGNQLLSFAPTTAHTIHS